MAKRMEEKQGSEPTDFWALKALNTMIADRNPDGSLGYMAENGPQGREWYRYFRQEKMMEKANYLASRMRQGLAYMVPTEWPEQFDPAFKPSKDRFFEPPKQTDAEKVRVLQRMEELKFGLKVEEVTA